MSEQTERRADTAAVLVLVQHTHDDVKSMRKELADHVVKETSMIALALADIMKRAFPDGDADRHRQAHETALKLVQARTDFYYRLAFELAKWTLLGFAGWLLIYAWKAFLQGPK